MQRGSGLVVSYTYVPVEVNSLPEPGTFAILGIGGAAAAVRASQAPERIGIDATRIRRLKNTTAPLGSPGCG